MKVCIFGAGALGSHIAARMSSTSSAAVSGRRARRSARSDPQAGRAVEIRRAGNPRQTDDGDRRSGVAPAAGRGARHAKGACAAGDRTRPRALACAQGLRRVHAERHPVVVAARRQGRAQGPLPLLDPEGALWTRLRERTLGCVVYSPNEIVAPGVVVHIGGNRWVIGEPSDQKTARLQAVVDLFCKSDCPPTSSPICAAKSGASS